MCAVTQQSSRDTGHSSVTLSHSCHDTLVPAATVSVAVKITTVSTDLLQVKQR